MADRILRPRIMLIHALEESMAPARDAFADWPEAEVFDVLDTSLAVDIARTGKLDDAMMERFHVLADYASRYPGKGAKAAAILFTCSAFGPAIDAVKQQLAIPVLRPNEAAFQLAIAAGKRIGLIVSFEPSLAALSSELETMARDAGKTIEIKAMFAAGALAALKAGQGETHDQHVLEAANGLRDVDVIVLGQFSLARAQTLLQKSCDIPIITTPGAAVAALKARLE